MKSCFVLLLCLPMMLSSCFKSGNKGCTYTDSSLTASAAEITFLQNYMATYSIPAMQHYSGIYYTIENAGTGSVPGICSNVALNYSGSILLTGDVFESNNTTAGISFILGQLIIGMQKGIPLLKSGGKITLYVPPSLGYGTNDKYDDQGNLAVPANSYLKFTIHILDVY